MHDTTRKTLVFSAWLMATATISATAGCSKDSRRANVFPSGGSGTISALPTGGAPSAATTPAAQTPPQITGLTPRAGLNHQPVILAVTGSGFSGTTSVSFSAPALTPLGFVVISDTELQVTVPAGAPVGDWELLVDNAMGNASSAGAGLYTVRNLTNPDQPGAFTVGQLDEQFVGVNGDSLDARIYFPAQSGTTTPDPTGAPYPVIVFNHAFKPPVLAAGVDYRAYTYISEHLASFGFIVICPDLTSNVRLFGAGSLGRESAQRDADDSRAALDHMELLNTSPQHPLAGLMDLSNAGFAGHSLGGLGALLGVADENRLRGTNARFQAVAALSAVSRELPFNGNGPITVSDFSATPALLIGASIDRITPFADLVRVFGQAGRDSLLFQIAGGNHSQFKDSDARILGDGRATITPDEQHAVVRRYLVAWFNAHLRGLRTVVADYLYNGTLIRSDPRVTSLAVRPGLASSPASGIPTTAPSSGTARSALQPAFANVASYSTSMSGGDTAQVYHPAPPDLATNPNYSFPVAVFLQASGVASTDYASLAEHVARRGIAVIIPDHVPTGGGAPTTDLAVLTIGLDHLGAESVRAGSPLHGKLDITRAAAIGHGLGGLAALYAVANRNDPPVGMSSGWSRPSTLRCGVAINLDAGSTTTPVSLDNDTLPVALIHGRRDGVTTLDQARETYDGVSDPSKAMIIVEGANHFMATDGATPLGALRNDPNASTIAQAEAVAAVGRWTGEFLRAHLLNDVVANEAVYVKDLHPDPAVTVTSLQSNPTGLSFTRHVVAQAGSAQGPAFVTATDFDGDGIQELLVSKFGQVGFPIPAGEVTLHRMGTTLGQWTSTDIIPRSEGVHWPNRTTVDDIDGDGDLDVVVACGFLITDLIPLLGFPSGRLLWLENQGAAGWQRHDLVSRSPLFYHEGLLLDVDGDGLRDLVSVGERKPLFGQSEAQVHLFRGTSGPERFESTPQTLSDGLGSIPSLNDMDGDGDMDIVSAEYFHPGGASFAWLERTGPANAANPGGTWSRHVIDATSGPAIQLTLIPNLQGDGVLRAVGTNHTNGRDGDPWESAVLVFDIPADPRQPWIKRQISSGILSRPSPPRVGKQAAPGIFGHGDIDGDGDIDLVVSGDGDPRVYWLEQYRPGKFVTHQLEKSLGQAGGMVITDINGDGRNEIIVTGYDDNVIAIHERR